MEPWWSSSDGRACLYAGDALAVLAEMETGSVDSVICDPPYSSGGQYRGDRTADPRSKYLKTGSGNQSLASFSGDNRDQRAYAYWSALWLAEALRVTRPGGTCLLFTDWRQLPVTTDAMQAGGWTWRGIVPWYKPDARPQLGRFTAACEYVVWGSNGAMPIAPVDGGPSVLPGFLTAIVPRDRVHVTQKPLGVMRQLVQVAPRKGTVLDLFSGSGTTGVASVLEARRFIGSENQPAYLAKSRERIETALRGYRDDGVQLALGAE